MKIYIMTDLEGVSGVVEFEDRRDESPRNIALRQKYSRLLAGEVNAAVEGAFAGGATEVLVDDSHGGGYTIDVELLDDRVRVLHGRERPRIMAGIDDTFDGMFIIGAHAMACTRGAVLYHTMSVDTRQIRLNGRPIGEIGIFAFCAGAFGVPTLLVTGDAAACREASALVPRITTLAVKDGLSRYAAIAHSPAKARQMIREAAKQAIARRATVVPLVLDPPYTYQDETFPKDGNCRESNPAKWTTNDEVHADSARELIARVWGREV